MGLIKENRNPLRRAVWIKIKKINYYVQSLKERERERKTTPKLVK